MTITSCLSVVRRWAITNQFRRNIGFTGRTFSISEARPERDGARISVSASRCTSARTCSTSSRRRCRTRLWSTCTQSSSRCRSDFCSVSMLHYERINGRTMWSPRWSCLSFPCQATCMRSWYSISCAIKPVGFLSRWPRGRLPLCSAGPCLSPCVRRSFPCPSVRSRFLPVIPARSCPKCSREITFC